MEIEWSERHEHFASARWTRSETDFLGRIISESRPGFGGSTLVTSNLYDSAGRLLSTFSLSTRLTDILCIPCIPWLTMPQCFLDIPKFFLE